MGHSCNNGRPRPQVTPLGNAQSRSSLPHATWTTDNMDSGVSRKVVTLLSLAAWEKGIPHRSRGCNHRPFGGRPRFTPLSVGETRANRAIQGIWSSPESAVDGGLQRVSRWVRTPSRAIDPSRPPDALVRATRAPRIPGRGRPRPGQSRPERSPMRGRCGGQRFVAARP